jgi:6-phosphogluconolactonase
MRSFLLTAVLACFGLALTGAAWAQGAVYAMTNAVGNNQIIVWARAADGTLTYLQTVDTGGGGSGVQIDPTDSLGSQGSVVVDAAHHWLFAVNTESTASNTQDCNIGSISSFRIALDGSLTLAGKVASGGLFPNSLTARGNQLWVLNAGGPSNCGTGPNITSFSIGWNGVLSAIPFSGRAIDPGPNPGRYLNCDPGMGPFTMPIFNCGLNPPAFPRSPAQIGYTPKGDALVVTDKGINAIYVFPLKQDRFGRTPAVALAPTIWKAPGITQPTYFGFAFDLQNRLIVAEPFGASSTIPAGGASAVSSFAFTRWGTLQPINLDAANQQTASCWVAIEPLSKSYAYVSNNGSSDISIYLINPAGKLVAIDKTAASAYLSGPNDLAVASSLGKGFLYVLSAASGKVSAFQIIPGGLLIHLGDVDGLPPDAGAQGLAAY